MDFLGFFRVDLRGRRVMAFCLLWDGRRDDAVQSQGAMEIPWLAPWERRDGERRSLRKCFATAPAP